ncbi:glycosyltransferase family 4 protein [Gemmata sp. JC673]|uniref:Glycosyltransferase family 4 protein n=1 Tax=Gemmata algarum TaxID=2975278 RepID=A0ABU5ESK4_9BACT|nr:glycosyltransferase family 4 protein [Gemmata algarum]MDY3558322.1 glycosyltransferase family 4 protein [Gemmata algarum]
MRILIATSHRAVVGGVETYLRAALPLLRGRGHEVGLLCANPAPADAPVIDAACPGLVVQFAPDPGRAVAVAAGWRPDVVFTHELPDPAADAALAERFPTVYFAHNYAGACVSGTKCHAAPAPQPCARALGPMCLALYGPRRCGGLNPLTAVRLYRTNRRRQATFPRYRAVLVASEHMAREVVRNGAPTERVHLVPLFPTGTSPDARPPVPKPRTGRVLFVGRITRLKGWNELLAAVPAASAQLGRPLTLVVAGDGPDRAAFEAGARARGVPAEFLGWVGPERREAEMRAADVLAAPSIWPEPFGLVGIEAGCVGLPAVAFATGGIPDWLRAGVSGELAPSSPNSEALAAALVRALSDEGHWQRLRIGAWEAAKRFTPEAHQEKLVTILEAAAQRVALERLRPEP